MKWPDWTGRRTPPGDALYRRIVELARSPSWFQAGGVPDTVDGRFDAVALVLALVMLRLEREDAARFSVDVTERFIADMDGSLRQMGIGDPTVGKQVGHMVGALGGRLGAYREALAGQAPLAEALARNLYRGAAVDPVALAWSEGEVRRLVAKFDALPEAAIREGRL
ncbi:ubiquinol-cytochrome C chaperone family protein [Sphingosinicellaceae bacterium]|nr:ubiquinol-cytochrome C chaperone family protein [Sphingosinicellaceae bacterium]